MSAFPISAATARRSGRRPSTGSRAEGLRYSGFHTTAMCSTTRAALLTGRNHHSVGVGCLANFDSGYPGYRGKIAREAGTLAEMLRAHAYRNYMIGKWHVTPLTESGATGPFDGWPLGRGFDRFYGFLDAETDQYAPELVVRQHPYRSARHLCRRLSPDLGPGRSGDPLHRRSHRRPARSAVADLARARRLPRAASGARRHHQGATTRSSPMAGTSSASSGWRGRRRWGSCRRIPRCRARNDGVKAWDEHSADEKRVFTRLQSAFAGMLDHADRHLARLIAFPGNGRHCATTR